MALQCARIGLKLASFGAEFRAFRRFLVKFHGEDQETRVSGLRREANIYRLSLGRVFTSIFQSSTQLIESTNKDKSWIFCNRFLACLEKLLRPETEQKWENECGPIFGKF